MVPQSILTELGAGLRYVLYRTTDYNGQPRWAHVTVNSTVHIVYHPGVLTEDEYEFGAPLTGVERWYYVELIPAFGMVNFNFQGSTSSAVPFGAYEDIISADDLTVSGVYRKESARIAENKYLLGV